jgi:hypothetical protein
MTITRSLFLSAAFVGGLLGAVGAGPAAARGNNQCLLSTNVENFSAPDDHTVYLRVGVKQIWKLGLMNDCLELPYHLNVSLQATPGDPWICQPVQATIIDHGGAVPRRCPVTSMRLLTPSEVVALPKNLRP